MATRASDTMQLSFRTVDGTRIRCAEAIGSHHQSVLLTCPWPESVYAFAPIWPTLAAHADLFAIDLPGFGQYERRDDLLSPRAMGEFLTRVIEAFDLGSPHIVGPDVGTAAALFAAASRPDLVSSVIVGSGGAAVPIQLGDPLAAWVLDPDLDQFRAKDPRTIVGAAIDTIEGPGVSDEIRADYLDSYAGDRFVESMRYVRTYPDALPDLARHLPQIRTPVQIIAGLRDSVVPLANARFLRERLPNSKLTVLDAGHFVWEEQPTEYASVLVDWIKGTGEPIAVARAQNQAEAEFLQGLLLGAGVPSMLRRAPGFDVPDFLAAGPRDVLVPASTEQVARLVLEPRDVGLDEVAS